jgi:hypothetical protein
VQKETLDTVKLLSRNGTAVVEARVHYFRSDNANGAQLGDVIQTIGKPHIIDFLLKDGNFVVPPSSAAFFRVFLISPK